MLFCLFSRHQFACTLSASDKLVVCCSSNHACILRIQTLTWFSIKLVFVCVHAWHLHALRAPTNFFPLIIPTRIPFLHVYLTHTWILQQRTEVKQHVQAPMPASSLIARDECDTALVSECFQKVTIKPHIASELTAERWLWHSCFKKL